MIILKNLNKFYNKNKLNEIHVLKDININLGEQGLTALYGKSGSGKTTLLHCISGIENIDTGFISIENINFSNYKNLNEYKSKNIGLVFQDYCLIENQSVQDNLLLALEIAGQKRVVEKVNIALLAVGMNKYNKRKINTLSGGQKQRIAIARALVINPKIILADEPTGNLDQKNSQIILKLFKFISKQIPVVIVSHDKQLVNHYANRIIELSDGKIVSDKSKDTIENTDFEYKDYDICLSDFFKEELCLKNGNKITLYHNDNIKNIDLIFSHDELIIRDNKGNQIKSVNKKIIDNIEIHKENTQKNTIPKTDLRKQLNTTTFISIKKKKLKNPFNNFSKLNKITTLAMCICAILIAISMSYLGKSINVDEAKYRYSDKNSLTIYNSLSLEQIKTLNNKNNVKAILPYKIEPLFLYICQLNYLESSINDTNSLAGLQVKPLPINLITSEDIVLGRMPQNNFEVVIDKNLINKIFNQGSLYGIGSQLGIVSYNGYIGTVISFYENININIVGISDKASPTIFMHKDLLYILSLESVASITEKIFTENLTNFTNSSISFDNTNQVYISETEFKEKGLIAGNNDTITLGEQNYIVKGFYTPIDKTDKQYGYIISSETLENIIFNAISNNYCIEILVDDVESSQYELMQSMGLYSSNTYLDEMESYLFTQKSAMTVQLFFTIIIALTAFVLYYMVVKSSITFQKRTIAIKCALGIKRKKILQEYITNACIFTSIFALPCYTIMLLVIQFILKNASSIFTMLSFSISYAFLGCTILFAIPIIASCLSLLKYFSVTSSKLLKG